MAASTARLGLLLVSALWLANGMVAVGPKSGQAQSKKFRPKFRPSARRPKLTFGGAVQRARSAEELLSLAASWPGGSSAASSSLEPTETVTLLRRLVALSARDDDAAAALLADDARLHGCLRDLNVTRLAANDVAGLAWACAMLRRPLRPTELPLSALGSALDIAAGTMEVHAAAMAVWAWRSLSIPAADTPPAPERLLARSAELPFAVHVGAVDASLLSLDALIDEASPGRDAVRSGSAVSDQQVLREKRLTAWQSEAGRAFAYSGKQMPPRLGRTLGSGMSPNIGAVRDALAANPSIARLYDSVLINVYEDGKSGMRFHSDPGQGAEGGWGYSTCVVSSGACREIVFRRIGQPESRCSFALRTGDVVEMWGDCQAEYQHAVKVEASEGDAGQRVSLVYKRTLEAERERASVEPADGSRACGPERDT